MNARKRRELVLSIFTILIISVVWFLVSFGVCVICETAEDPAHMTVAPNPWLLRGIYSVMLFPFELISMEWLYTHCGARRAAELALLGIFVNSILWSFALVFLFRLFAKLLSARKSE